MDIILRPEESSSNDGEKSSTDSSDEGEEKKAVITSTFEAFQVVSSNEVTHFVIDFHKVDDSDTFGESGSGEDSTSVEEEGKLTVSIIG